MVASGTVEIELYAVKCSEGSIYLRNFRQSSSYLASKALQVVAIQVQEIHQCKSLTLNPQESEVQQPQFKITGLTEFAD